MKPRLHVLRIRLPGQWSDGWIYKEHLLLWSRTGQLHVAGLAAIARSVRAQVSPALSVAADYLIFRNDWKVGEQFERLRTIPNFSHLLLREFPHNRSARIEIDTFQPIPTDFESIPGIVLDSAVYADRIYIGSTAGLFETRFSPDAPATSSPVVQRLDHRIAAVTAKYSAVNSSAGEQGLWFGPVLFGERWWRHEDAESSFRRTAELSRDNSFAAQHLLNYTDESFPKFLRAQMAQAKTTEAARYPETQVVGYDTQADIGKSAAAAMQFSRKMSLSGTSPDLKLSRSVGSARVLGNSNFRLLVLWQGSLRVLDVSAYKGKDIEVRPDDDFGIQRTGGISPTSILKTYAIGSGFLVELMDQIRLITSAGSYVLLRDRAARVRTFIHALRYRDVALIVEENGVSLVGFMELP